MARQVSLYISSPKHAVALLCQSSTTTTLYQEFSLRISLTKWGSVLPDKLVVAHLLMTSQLLGESEGSIQQTNARYREIPYKKKFLKNSIFWDITRRSPLEVNGRFGDIYRPYLQG
jgi:hypothetical protein